MRVIDFHAHYFGRVFFGCANLGEQRGVGVLAVGNNRLRYAAPQLFDDHFPPTLALSPFLVGRKANPDCFHTRRSSQLQRDRARRVEYGNCLFHFFSY